MIHHADWDLERHVPVITCGADMRDASWSHSTYDCPRCAEVISRRPSSPVADMFRSMVANLFERKS